MNSYLAIIIQPVEREVLDPDRCPLIIDLPPRTIDYVGDLVGYHEFQVLPPCFQLRLALPERNTRRLGTGHHGS